MSAGVVLLAQGLGIVILTAISVFVVWVVCGAVFCYVLCGLSRGCCEACSRIRHRWLQLRHQ
ncbi:MAG: hypothetical protein ACWGON_00800 [Gemmatimonadota bacterium]